MTPLALVRSCRSGLAAVTASCVFLVMPSPAFAAATFTLINTDLPGVGFNDPTPVSPFDGNPGTTLGEQRLNAVRYAAEIWGAALDSDVDIRAVIVSAPGCPFGGYTSVSVVVRDFVGAPLANTWYPIALANKLAGMDLCPEGGSCTSSDDMTIAVGRDCGLYLGLLSTGFGTHLVSLMLHELGHGLGFTTQMDTFTGQKLLGFDDVYMRNLEDHQTGKLYPEMTDAERAAANMNPPHLHWVGPSVVAASGILLDGADPSGHVEMMAFSGGVIFGTSVYHFASSLSPPQVMTTSGTQHDVGLALHVMRDIGWFAEGAPAPPEPDESWQCYTARDLADPRFAPVSVVETDDFGSRTATLKRPVMLCSSATVGAGGAPSPAKHLVCYQAKDVGDATPGTLSTDDQFGTLSLKVKKSKLLCVPAAVSSLP
jgi:hypothetical protein